MIPQRSPSPAPGSSSGGNGAHFDLPPNHFLSLQPSFAQSTDLYPSGAPTTSAHESNGLAPNTASLASADFDVDVRTGFLPGSKNVVRLEGKYAVWEEALDAARGGQAGDGLIVGGQRDKERLWREAVNMMPLVDIDELRSLPLVRRAHVVLTFLAHFYAHTTPALRASASTSALPAEKEPIPIPACISVPLLKVSPMLGLPPVLTYADTVLYNFLPSNPAVAPSASSNLPSDIITTFTRTRSEEQFFLISALTEIVGAEALRLMRQSLDELFLADEKALRRLTVYLRKLAQQIDKISDVTMTLMKEVDPEEFYHLIRPWFKGGDADGPTSAGWDYLGLTASGDPEDLTSSVAESSSTAGKRGKLFSGPSAGQSSLIHAIDIFLTVDHSPTEEERAEAMAAIEDPSQSHITVDSTPVSSDAPASPAAPHGHGAAPRGEATFVQRMLQYMPLPHRSFILHLSTHPTPLRPLVVHYAHSHPALATAYDGALESLRRFREKHMRVVSLFIVQQARRSPSERVRKMMGLLPETEEERALAEEEGKTVDINEIRGTGGSALFKFLKRCRDNTTKAMVKPSGAGYELE
ncbi:hypothetical protein IAU59_004480 [Kwoniella sp. CBS 9459]